MTFDKPQFERVFGEAVARVLEEQGRPISMASSQTTVRINTELVPVRANQLLEVTRTLLGRESIRGARVLEAGSGFGALATYLAASEEPVSLIAIDVREDYVQLASSCASMLGLDARLRFEAIDMRDLGAFPDGSFDLVFANNSFLYVVDEADAGRTLSEFARVLAPGGEVVILQANRWRLREPFTGSPLIHLLPVPIASILARHTALRHNHGRVRLASPGGLARDLRRAGLRPTRPVNVRSKPVSRWPRRSFGRYFAVAARKPAAP